MRKIRQDPSHSEWYVERFRTMARQGADLAGEARMIDAMVPRGSHILDAGCGPGRVGGELARRGHSVVGIDVDPVLITAAREDYPDVDWHAVDLAEMDLDDLGVTDRFDACVCAGNVVPFLAPSTREDVLGRIRAALRPDGQAAFGFGAGRGYAFDEFLEDARRAGLTPDLLLSTWDLRRFTEDSDFLVAVLRPAT